MSTTNPRVKIQKTREYAQPISATFSLPQTYCYLHISIMLGRFTYHEQYLIVKVQKEFSWILMTLKIRKLMRIRSIPTQK